MLPEEYNLKPNYEEYKIYSYWTGLEGICLCAGAEPPRIEDFGKWVERACNYEQLDDIFDKIVLINRLTVRAIEAWELVPDIDQMTPYINTLNHKFYPKTFVTWLFKKGIIPIPDKLKDLIISESHYSKNRGDIQPYLDKRHPEFRREIAIFDEVWRYFFECGMIDPTKPRRNQIKKYLDKHYKKDLYKGDKRNESMFNRIVTLVNGGINKYADENSEEI